MEKQGNGKSALLLGKGGFGMQLCEWLFVLGYGDVKFLDDNSPEAVGPLRDYGSPALRAEFSEAFVGLGDNKLRVELLKGLAAAGYDTPVVRHPKACIGFHGTALGPGTVVGPLAYVGTEVQAGTGCLINAGAIVDHGAVLGEGVHVAPGAVVKAGAVVPNYTKVESGQIIFPAR